jgi:hypothetical protein
MQVIHKMRQDLLECGDLNHASFMNSAELPRVLDARALRVRGISASTVRNEVQRRRWRRLARGLILTRPDPPTRADWVVAGLCAAGEGVVSGWDALRCYGLAMRDRPPASVLILSTRGGCRDVGQAHIRRVGGPVSSRRLSVDDDTLPLARIAAPARAVTDAAPFYHREDTVRALVMAVVQGGHCTPDELIAELDSAALRGSAALRRSVEHVRDGARSVAEVYAAEQLRHAAVPDFELNVPIVDAQQRIIAIADILWRDLWAILEIDSHEFHFAAEDWRQTTHRHNRLTACGFAVTHYPPSRVMSDHQWTKEVTSWLSARAMELHVPYRTSSRIVRDGPPLQLPIGSTT